ncbi:DUF4192 family protein [Microbacterium cremeum]|uniref:DUF4192 family protein n=1 Tax=Microbacterium cremeum TaxID=2782169 RepID=UPI0018894F59|nr:DUF4192 family protein [Microbacterium cremeum]
MNSFSRTAIASPEIIYLPDVDEHLRDDVWDFMVAMVEDALEDDLLDDSDDDEREVPSGGALFTHAEAFVVIVPLLESCLARGDTDLSAVLVAEFALMAMLPAIPETIAVQVAFGRGAGEEQVREMARLLARARHRGLTVDEYIAQLSAANAVPRGKLVRLFHGETRRVPDPDRLKRGISLLRVLTALAPEPARPPLLCSIAWLQWAQGKRAVASAYLAEAIRIEPEHILARGLAVLVSSKAPRWAIPSAEEH